MWLGAEVAAGNRPGDRMRTIWKTEHEIADEPQRVELQAGHPVHVAWQNGKPCIWWDILDSSAPNETYELIVRGTGHAVGPRADWQHIGTIQEHSGALFWHWFYRHIRRQSESSGGTDPQAV